MTTTLNIKGLDVENKDFICFLTHFKQICLRYLDRARDDLTLCCYIYNVYDITYRYFCAEFKSDEWQLENFRFFFGNLRSKVNFKVKGQFQGQI